MILLFLLIVIGGAILAGSLVTTAGVSAAVVGTGAVLGHKIKSKQENDAENNKVVDKK
jgi:hypothetical protein